MAVLWLLLNSLVLSSLTTSPSAADTRSALVPAGTARFDHLTVADGLAHSSVWDIHQDSRGFMWFATQDGLNRYDGYEFKVYRHQSSDASSIASSEILDIYEDQAGDLWLQTRNQGLTRYLRASDSFDHHRHDPEDAASLWSDTVRQLFEDPAGRLWVGTAKGLNRFDRSTGKFARIGQDPEQPAVSKLDGVFGFAAQKTDALESGAPESAVLWLATGHGVARLISADGVSADGVSADGEIEIFRHDPDDPASVLSKEIRAMHVDDAGGLWLGTPLGLDRFNPDSRDFSHFHHAADNPASLSHDHILEITSAGDGKLWIVSLGGLDRFDPKTLTVQRIWRSPTPSNDWLNVSRLSSNGDLWLGTGSFGLIQVPASTEAANAAAANAAAANTAAANTAAANAAAASTAPANAAAASTEAPVFHFHDKSRGSSLGSDSILALTEDRNGLLWIGTYTGIDRYHPQRGQFTTYSSHPSFGGLSGEAIWGVHQDRAGILWIGTYDQGLNRFDRANGLIEHFPADPQHSDSLPSSVVTSLLEDSTGTLWVGSYGGLSRFDPKARRFATLRHDPTDADSLGSDDVFVLLEDRRGGLWLGTAGGVDRYDRQSGKFRHYQHDADDPTSLAAGNIYALFEDHSGAVWAGTMDGDIARYDRQQDRFSRFTLPFAERQAVELPGAGAFHEDDANNLWIGTYGVGLLKLSAQRDEVRRFTTKEGLPSDSVQGILADESGQLWLCTNRGLSRFDPSSETFHNYGVADGLQGEVFSSGSFFRGANGEMFFGGVAGLTAFQPQQIHHRSSPPAVVLTDFRVFDEPIQLRRRDERSPLIMPISETRQLTLDHRKYVFSLQFAALDFADAANHRYAYRLAGFDRNWTEVDATRRSVRYSNLAPGRYNFEVKAKTSHSDWNEAGIALAIRVLPPPWLTWWAYALYALALVSAIAWFLESHKRKLRREQAINERLRRADRLKDDFLANTSHELRTPLYGMIGLTESLLDDAAESLAPEAREDLSMIVASGRRLSGLVDDILDFSKLTRERLQLKPVAVDLNALCSLVLRLSRPLAADKGLKLTNALPTDLPAVRADENRLQQILHNLVGNAIKFTDQGGVELAASRQGDWVEVQVSDTGIGISLDRQDSIFEAFQQADASNERAHGGTGLGLAVTRELVALHGGNLRVSSEPGQGSTFSFTLEISSQPLAAAPSDGEALRQITDTTPEAPPLTQRAATHDHTATESRILLVDDEPIIRRVLANHLRHQGYEVVQAASGEEALSQVGANDGGKANGGKANGDRDGSTFDLILLDVMMPRMSGYEVCRQLRRNYTSHQLPIVFLSAKNQIQDLVEGLSLGANDYLTKPIGKKELLARVETHLELVRLHRQLQGLLEQKESELELMRELLPICCHCKRVRDDDGAWSELEEYVTQHTETELSHSICPTCLPQLYPEIVDS